MLAYLISLSVFCFGFGRRIEAEERTDGRIVEDSFNLHRINEGVNVNGRELFQGDIIHDATVDRVTSKRSKRGLAKQPHRLWENNIVPYKLDKSLGIRMLQALEVAMRAWERMTCIRFVRKADSDVNYVLFTSQHGCYANVGRGDGEQILSIGKNCATPGFALHELAHIIGFFHEQSRPDRDEYVDILWDNIIVEKREQFGKYTTLDIDTRGVPYDYISITHYGPYDFRTRPGLETLKAKRMSHNPADMGQRRYLSQYDVIGANIMYQCKEHIEALCPYGTKYTKQHVQEKKDYACKQGDEINVCSMTVETTKNILVCDWEGSDDSDNEIKEEWYKNEIFDNTNNDNIPPTPEHNLCVQSVPVEKTITVPCENGTCEKTITTYKEVEGPCWIAMDDYTAYGTASWSEWSPWTPCSRTVGRGAQYRFRACINDANGRESKDCPGYNKSVRFCCSGQSCNRRTRFRT